MNARDTAERIRRASKSNLALSFIALSPQRRRDITTFYAFCRLIDDIADAPGESREQKARELDDWQACITTSRSGEPPLAAEVRAVIARYAIPLEHFYEVLAGVAMDLAPVRYRTWEELRLYCHRVASVVGLISIEIFGYRNRACRIYAVDLGLALQLTNILRDVAVDLENERRIYLPEEDMARFAYLPEDLLARRDDNRFRELMHFEAARAQGFYESAIAHLPAEDRSSMVAAEIMRSIYWRLLTRMRRDEFRVFAKRYALGSVEKAAVVTRVLLGQWGARLRGHPRSARLSNH